MREFEEKILRSFHKYMGAEVKDLNLIVAFNEDTWPDEENVYSVLVMESKDNGKVWDCECTKNGIIKNTIEL